jgi:outer membrane protein TolC
MRAPLVILAALSASAPAGAATRLSLADALAIARRHRSDVVQADLDVQLANLNVLRGWLERVHLNVSASFTEQYDRQNLNAPPELCGVDNACNVAPEQHLYNVQASLNVPVWSGFTVEADLRRAKAYQRAARADKESKLRALDREVTAAYWGVRRAEMLLELARAALKRNEEVAQLVKVRLDRGIVSPVDFNRAATSVLRERNEVVALSERVAQARTELAAALQICDEVELTDNPPTAPPPLPDLDQAIADAERLRPEIRVAQAHLDAQVEGVRAAKGGLWPHVDLFAQGSIANQALGLPQPNAVGNFTAGVAVSWVVFDMMTTWNNVREAQILRDRVAQDRVRIDFTVRAEVHMAHARLWAAIERRQSLARAVSLAESTADLVRKRYLTGTAIFIELLDAQAEQIRLESEAADNAVELADASAQLAIATGHR